MPANSLTDPNTMILYLCIQHSDMTKIDFSAVGQATGLNVHAARMRYTRLKKAIERGIVDGKITLKPAGGAGTGAPEYIESDDQAAVSPSPQKKQKMTRRAPKRKKGEAAETDTIKEGGYEEDSGMVQGEDKVDD